MILAGQPGAKHPRPKPREGLHNNRSPQKSLSRPGQTVNQKIGIEEVRAFIMGALGRLSEIPHPLLRAEGAVGPQSKLFAACSAQLRRRLGSGDWPKHHFGTAMLTPD